MHLILAPRSCISWKIQMKRDGSFHVGGALLYIVSTCDACFMRVR